MTRAEKKRAKLGRICMWCDAEDGAVFWSPNKRECAACQRQRLRSKCGRCGGPRWRSSGCLRCDKAPLPGTIDVVVVDGAREHVVRRVVRSGGRIAVAGTELRWRDHRGAPVVNGGSKRRVSR